jgi:hypothetical protein
VTIKTFVTKVIGKRRMINMGKGEIRFKGRDGKVKFTASNDGHIKVHGKDGKVTEVLKPHDTGKSETVKVETKDLK